MCDQKFIPQTYWILAFIAFRKKNKIEGIPILKLAMVKNILGRKKNFDAKNLIQKIYLKLRSKKKCPKKKLSTKFDLKI